MAESTREMQARYARIVADKALLLRSVGNLHPTHAEIAAATKADEDCETMGPGLVRGYLTGAKAIIEQQEIIVTLVSDKYYEAAAVEGYAPDSPPENVAIAKAFIPRGNGNQSAGLYFVQHEDDSVYLAFWYWQTKCGTGKIRKQVDRTLLAVEQGKLSTAEAIGQFQSIHELMQPRREIPGYLQRQLAIEASSE